MELITFNLTLQKNVRARLPSVGPNVALQRRAACGGPLQGLVYARHGHELMG